MSAVTLSAAQLEFGPLPDVCVRTGRPATTTMRQFFFWTPSWTWLLLLFGAFPFLIAFVYVGHRATSDLPVTADVRRRRLALIALTIFGIVGGLALTLQGASGAPVLAAGLLLMVAGAVAGFVQLGESVAGRLDPTGITVTLHRVHPDFAAALVGRED